MKKNLKNDAIFKAFFSRKGNEAYLIDFLESLLKIKIDKIQVEQEVDLGRMSPNEKSGSLDIQAILNDGIIVDIEMQVVDNHNIVARTMFYTAKQVARWTVKGEEYKDMKKIVMINILDYACFPYENYINKVVNVLDEHREHTVMTEVEWYFIELSKFRRSNPDMNIGINQWLAFLDGERKDLVEVAMRKNKLLKNVEVEFLELSGEEETRRLDELKDKWERDYNSGVSYAREEGIQQGQRSNSLEIARKMLEKGIDIELIVECTGLSKEEIEQLS